MDGKGVSLADAERVVETNLNKIAEKLHKTRLTCCCCSSSPDSAELADAVNVHNHCNFSAAEVLKSHQDAVPCHGCGTERSEDIGGDMNHIHRVTIQLLCCKNKAKDYKDCHRTVATVIVKTAPDEILYLKEECGESVSVDQNKVEFEYRSLLRFNEIQPNSVPAVYLLDRPHKTIVMEDLSQGGFIKLQDVLVCGDVDNHLVAIESALAFIGLVHRVTWLEKMERSEKSVLNDNHSNSAMKQLMAELLFDRPFNSDERSNTFNSQLSEEVRRLRGDAEVLGQLAKLKDAFLHQNDCLCHGDLATDNVMVNVGQFRIIDLEFSGVGLRAYDLALFLEMTIFRLLCSHHSDQPSRCRSLHCAVRKGIEAYEQGVGEERGRDPVFVEQTCGLIALELMWMVFGSYNIVEFAGDPEPERMMLSVARNLLLKVDTGRTIAWNIKHQLSLHKLLYEMS